jgi:hypothetical protein
MVGPPSASTRSGKESRLRCSALLAPATMVALPPVGFNAVLALILNAVILGVLAQFGRR